MTRLGDFQKVAGTDQRIVFDSKSDELKTSSKWGRFVSVLTRKATSENQAVKQSFVRSMKNAYGAEVAQDVRSMLDMSSSKPLTGRMIRQVLDEYMPIHRRSDKLQTGDLKQLLGKAGVIDPDGVVMGVDDGGLHFLKDQTGVANASLHDKLTFTTDEKLKEMLSEILHQPADSAAVTRCAAALRSGVPTQITNDGATLTLNGVAYQRGQFLGEGGFGKAHVYNGPNGEAVVVKSLRALRPDEFDPSEVPQEMARLVDEARSESVAHRYATEGEPSEHVAGFHGPARSPDGQLHLIIENCSGGDVRGLWGRGEGQVGAIDGLVNSETVSPNVASKLKACLAHDLLKGMSHLQHKKNMTHLDMKPDNLFLDALGRAKIGDFGLAAEMMIQKLEQFWNTTNLYKAPEVDVVALLRGDARQLDMKADSYSVGYMIHELVSGTRPFYDVNPGTVIGNREEWYKTHNGLAEGEQSTGDEFWDTVINGLTARDPASRLGVDEALGSPVFESILDDTGATVKPQLRALLPMITSHDRLTRARQREQDPARQLQLDQQIQTSLQQIQQASVNV